MKKTLLAAFGAILLSAFATTAQADLIGDTISVDHYFPDASSLYEAHSVVVAAGTGDAINVIGAYNVNAEANSVLVKFIQTTGFTSSSFNGLVIGGIDEVISSVTVSTNLSGWDSSRLSWTAHSISSNWQSLLFNTDSFFNISVNGSSSVPDSGSMLALVGLGLVGLAGFRRKCVQA